MKKITAFILLNILWLTGLNATVFAQNNQEILIKNATVMTAANGTLQDTDILIRGGKITRIGKNLSAGANAKTIDATGKYVTPDI